MVVMGIPEIFDITSSLGIISSMLCQYNTYTLTMREFDTTLIQTSYFNKLYRRRGYAPPDYLACY